jgi:type II secretory pathway component GspD/PulD (secretin)
VEILDVSKNVVDAIGFRFGQTPFTVVLTGATVDLGFPFKSWSKMFTPNVTTPPTAGDQGTLAINSGTSTYSMALDFLRTQTDTKYLARPKILALNNETAEIKITTQETIGVVTTTQGQGTASSTTTSAERAETGISLRVTPQINPETGEITMFVMPTVKDTATSTIPIGGVGTTMYKDPEERSTKSTVRVKDGETIIMGGLIRNQRSDVITKLPFLGDIPILGNLFKHRSTTPNRERELLVFITPRIMKEAPVMTLAQATTLPAALPEREQAATSGVDRQAIISNSLDKFEKKSR